MMSDTEALYSDRGAHRFMPWSDLVAMVVRSYYGFEVQGGSEEDRSIERCYGSLLTTDICRVPQVKIGTSF